MQLTSRQWRTETEGVITPGGGYILPRLGGLDLGVVMKCAEACEIPVNETFLSRVHCFEAEVLIISRSGNEKSAGNGPCTPAQKEECKIIYGDFFADTCSQCKGR